MKNISKLFFVVIMLLFVASVVVGQDMASLRRKSEETVKAKNPQWKLITKQERGNQITYQWGTEKAEVTLTIFYGASTQEASEKMTKAIDYLSVGPGDKVRGFGDEAYLWKTPSNGYAGIRFRKANVYFDLSASSITLVEDLARKLAKHVPEP